MTQHSNKYRVCYLDSNDRRFKEEIVEADDDIGALIQAQMKVDACTIELWTQGRLISRLDPDPFRKNIRII